MSPTIVKQLCTGRIWGLGEGRVVCYETGELIYECNLNGQNLSIQKYALKIGRKNSSVVGLALCGGRGERGQAEKSFYVTSGLRPTHVKKCCTWRGASNSKERSFKFLLICSLERMS